MADGYDVKVVPGIGTTAIQVGNNRNGPRSLKNTGTTILEICNRAGDAYGTGFPLAIGETFNFDRGGLMEGPIFVASAAAGGECRLIGY